MPTWKNTLRAAGILRPDLCDDYTQQRSLVKEFAKKEYLAVRLLLPAALHPPVIAAVAFMHATDERIDTGAVSDRKHALTEWNAATIAATDGPHPSAIATLRTLADAVQRHPGLRRRIDTFLRGAHLEVDYTGFATEQDLQTYVAGYSLPAFMLTAGFLAPTHPGGDQASFEAACRALIESMQRADFLDDLAEDGAGGVIGIPHQDLARHQLTIADIAPGAPHPVRRSLTALVHEQADLAQDQLNASAHLPQLVEPAVRPFVTALWQLQNLKLSAVRNKGGNLVDGGAEAPMPAVLKILASQYWIARRAPA
ncbi:squalene/phytoene synthase family protein [Streptomyces sp. NBC_01433]|uniref:squalene/phytoene synthase family protein n=1 Tax=Streptomyces sp. NBC_01433 TaxID=2903864 RepID=UPI0022580314|nr:squalene/phytoene synthase family protein [Streptomyces sp. NBC_01433]MCX4682132.1 squalene/phytoene synthase family protein [Streptomyces sp. NBC_01433]